MIVPTDEVVLRYGIAQTRGLVELANEEPLRASETFGDEHEVDGGRKGRIGWGDTRAAVAPLESWFWM